MCARSALLTIITVLASLNGTVAAKTVSPNLRDMCRASTVIVLGQVVDVSVHSPPFSEGDSWNYVSVEVLNTIRSNARQFGGFYVDLSDVESATLEVGSVGVFFVTFDGGKLVLRNFRYFLPLKDDVVDLSALDVDLLAQPLTDFLARFGKGDGCPARDSSLPRVQVDDIRINP